MSRIMLEVESDFQSLVDAFVRILDQVRSRRAAYSTHRDRQIREDRDRLIRLIVTA